MSPPKLSCADYLKGMRICTRCIFGISPRPDSLEHPSQHIVHYHGWAYIVGTGPDDRAYWTLFDGLKKTEHGEDVKYSKDDETALAKQHFGDHITETTTFGELYNNRSMSTLVPLEEYVFKKWHFRRIITIGDSAHKVRLLIANNSMVVSSSLQFDPTSGQGGNGALESAALLVNALLRKLERSPERLSGEAIASAVSEVQTRRYQRAKRLVYEAHMLQLLISHRLPFSNLILKCVVPLLGLNVFVDVVVLACIKAPRIEKLPVPKRSRLVPFEDELPAAPIENACALWIPWALASGLLGLLLGAATCHPSLLDQLYGNKPAAGIVILTNLVPIFVAWLVESRRHGNNKCPLSLFVTLADDDEAYQN